MVSDMRASMCLTGEKGGGFGVIGPGSLAANILGCPEAISFVLMLSARPVTNSLLECPLSEIHEWCYQSNPIANFQCP
jgi:hypothetical protein